MAYTYQIRSWWAEYFKKGYDTQVVLLGRPGVKAYSFTLPAWRALESALQAHRYGTATIVSTYYPRYIGDSTEWSLHSYSGVAMDIDPYSAGNKFDSNTSWDFSKTKFTREQVNAVLAIRTNSGARVWRWGGDFGDYMHWQLDCRPSDIQSGIDQGTVPSGGTPPITEGDEMALKQGSKGDAVRVFQKALIQYNSSFLPKYGVDGSWGDETTQAVRIFQADFDLVETGVLDSDTVFCITPYQISGSVGDGGYAQLFDVVDDLDAQQTATEIELENLKIKLRGV